MTTTMQQTPGASPSQTVGPFFHDCLLRPDACRNVLTQPETAGERIRIEGRVVDGEGAGVPDALVEIWQADSHGRYNHPADTSRVGHLDQHFIGFGRSGTDADGRYWFETIRPAAVPVGMGDERMQAPHISVVIFARGLLNHLATRLYFAGEPTNEQDPVLQQVPSDRRATLLARAYAREGRTLYSWDIILQGAGETAFFNL